VQLSPTIAPVVTLGVPACPLCGAARSSIALIAGLKGLAIPPGIDALLFELDAEDCAAAVAILVGMVEPTTADELWKAVLPGRLHRRLAALHGLA
jgi:hypothetical protein